MLNQKKIEAEQNKDTITPEMAQAFAKANRQDIDLSMFSGQRVPAAILRPMGMYGAANLGGNAKVKAAEIGANTAHDKLVNGPGAKADKDNDKMLQDITTELGGLHNAYQQARTGGVFGGGLGNIASQGALAMHADRLPFVGPSMTNATAPAKVYDTAMKDAMFRVAKVLSGGRPNQMMQQELLGQIPQAGTDPKLAEKQFNNFMNAAKVRAQGMLNKAAFNDPAKKQAMQDKLEQLFNQYTVQNPGEGVTSNQESSVAQGQHDQRDIDAANKVVRNPSAYKPEHVAQAKAILGVQ